MRYTRGELARRTGLHSETLRYYEQLGLIPAPARSESGYRMYGEETEIRLGFIRDAKAHGFSLKEIAKALSLSGGSLTLEDFEALIARKKERLDRQIDALRAEHDRLSALYAWLIPEAEQATAEMGRHVAQWLDKEQS
ncbi:MerR family transcriptional regulator [Paenibacillus glufosinatiresistens]|uniref:MerR family transcriptional regulator n=1 Tax=Paenibacillus glufosinatiresistens TaxID=3070657 RepID=UPI00286EA39B|nr:MerR family transcriptional regulator [Paenibacillus sp. YX.27]